MTSRRRGLTVLELLIIIIVIVVAVVLLLRWRGASDSPTPAPAVTDSIGSLDQSAVASALATDLLFLSPVDTVATTGDTVTVRLLTTTGSGDPAPRVTVNLSIASGGGRLSTWSAVTGADGEMEVRWSLGAEPGPQMIRAMMDGNESSAITLEITTKARAGGSP